MDTRKLFYSKFSERQQTNQNSAEAKHFLDNPSIAKLYEEQRTSCEGKITIKECETILRSFHTGKTPSNEGIPIEFYKPFWPLLGILLLISSTRHMIIMRHLHHKGKLLSLLSRRKEKKEIT